MTGSKYLSSFPNYLLFFFIHHPSQKYMLAFRFQKLPLLSSTSIPMSKFYHIHTHIRYLLQFSCMYVCFLFCFCFCNKRISYLHHLPFSMLILKICLLPMQNIFYLRYYNLFLLSKST